ncbi:CbiQ family ECF transporter T component [Aquisalimonas asiatica]|uniref:Energy-coupling factor transport system permease protein n=1 Tax=Aquisalimonas asiatica TaxID=406100 RepID=A0A1H8RNT6_9GAMM|nr:CbiQ family ECF transporter T component [Aquisalimonas asiatica]SEO68035.1 energy-coupling factor transport system permease protein [Aquisalimonas asiatica]
MVVNAVRLHPAARILWLVSLAVMVARPGWLGLVLPALGLAFGCWRVRLSPTVVARSLWRLRWLFLTILVFYAWLTPGTPLVASESMLMPTRQGMLGGLERLLALGYLVVAVQLLLASTARQWLIAALHWWLRPFAAVGVDADRFALRLVLVLEAAPALREQIARARAATAGVPWQERVAALGATLVEDALRRADEAPPATIRIPRLPPMPPWQWLLPVLVGIGVLASAGPVQ